MLVRLKLAAEFHQAHEGCLFGSEEGRGEGVAKKLFTLLLPPLAAVHRMVKTVLVLYDMGSDPNRLEAKGRQVRLSLGG